MPLFGTPASSIPSASGNVLQFIKVESPKPPPKKALTRAQLLAKALKACKAEHKKSRSKRVACEKQARKKYGPIKSLVQKNRSARRSHRPRGGGTPRARCARHAARRAGVRGPGAGRGECGPTGTSKSRPAPTNLPTEGKGMIVVIRKQHRRRRHRRWAAHQAMCCLKASKRPKSSLRSKGTPVSQKNELGDSCSKQTGARSRMQRPGGYSPQRTGPAPDLRQDHERRTA